LVNLLRSHQHIIYYAADSILPVLGYYASGLSAGPACALAVRVTYTEMLHAEKRFHFSLVCVSLQIAFSKDIAVFHEKKIAILAEGEGAART
jgi:hypothetical protein